MRKECGRAANQRRAKQPPSSNANAPWGERAVSAGRRAPAETTSDLAGGGGRTCRGNCGEAGRAAAGRGEAHEQQQLHEHDQINGGGDAGGGGSEGADLEGRGVIG